MPEAENQALSVATNDSWRTWLMTGARRSGIDRRRMRGANKGLKKMLIEGMTNGDDRPHAWKDFSGAMIRHAVDDAMRALPHQDKQVVKLAYFGGYSNREIASEVGLTEATVQRRLRRALATISDYIQHGRAMGRRAVYAVLLWLTSRSIADRMHQVVQAAAVATAAAIIVTQPVSPVRQQGPPVAPAPAHQPAQARPATETQVAPAAQVLPPLPFPTSAPVPAVQVPQVVVPVTVPDIPPVTVPPLPSPPAKVKLPTL